MREELVILYNLQKTCEASPAQWRAVNELGEQVYIRFRFDTLTVHCPFDPECEDYPAFMATQILKIEHVRGEEYAGSMDEDEMLQLTGYTLGERVFVEANVEEAMEAFRKSELRYRNLYTRLAEM